MKICIFMILFSLFLISCSSHHPVSRTPRPAIIAKKVVKPTEAPVRTEYYAFWDLLNNSQLSLHFTNMDTKRSLTVILEEGLTKREIPSGHWELTGFEDAGKTFVSMNISKKFVFRMTSKKNVYAGSLVIGCPKIGSSNLKLLRSMKFFDRYPFSSSAGLCELVVGDDFSKVWSKVSKSTKSKKLNLINGL